MAPPPIFMTCGWKASSTKSTRSNNMKKRREILEAAGLGSAALMAAMMTAPGQASAETLPVLAEEKPKHHIRFAVCGMSHDHIHGMIGAVQRGGGELVSYWGAEPDKL